MSKLQLGLCIILISILSACVSPNSLTPARTISELDATEQSAERISLESFKIQYVVTLVVAGNREQLLNGQAQFESQGDVTRPETYINFIFDSNERAFYYGNGKAAFKNESGWEPLPVNETLLETFGTIIDRFPDTASRDLFRSTGLNLSRRNLESRWDYIGETIIEEIRVNHYEYESLEVELWNRLFALAAVPDITVSRSITELWIGSEDNLPYRVRFSLHFIKGFPESTALEIEMSIYDHNQPLSLPAGVPN